MMKVLTLLNCMSYNSIGSMAFQVISFKNLFLLPLLQGNELMVKEIIMTAQGEMALEEFLRQVREFWQQYELDLINYQNKCRLIRGWDDLFNKVILILSSFAFSSFTIFGLPFFRFFFFFLNVLSLAMDLAGLRSQRPSELNAH